MESLSREIAHDGLWAVGVLAIVAAFGLGAAVIVSCFAAAAGPRPDDGENPITRRVGRVAAMSLACFGCLWLGCRLAGADRQAPASRPAVKTIPGRPKVELGEIRDGTEGKDPIPSVFGLRPGGGKD